MTESTTSTNTQEFQAHGRFYPTLDSYISQVREISPPVQCKRALLKAYFITASNASSYYSCDCGEASAAYQYAANVLEVTPSAVAGAMRGRGRLNESKIWRFQVDIKHEHEVMALVQKFELSQATRILLSMRVGMGYLHMFELVQFIKSKSEIRDELNIFMADERYQVAKTQEYFESQLRRSQGHIQLSAERVRHGSDIERPGEFGKETWKQLNKLLAAGHTSEL